MEKKTYQITFMADLTEDDVRAMKKCFYDAMNESMEISPVWNLKLEEVDSDPDEPETDLPAWHFKKYEPSLEELLKLPMRHINNVKTCLEACKSKRDVYEVLKLVPNIFGEWCVEFDDEYDTFTVVNTYFDDDEGDLEEEYCFDYPKDWDYDSEWDFEEEEAYIDRTYHDYSEDELRKMGCFGGADEEDFCDDPDVDEELLAEYKKEGED